MFSSILATLRESSDKNSWSTAVSWSRLGIVKTVNQAPSELHLAVLDPRDKKTYDVHLILEEDEWTCTCNSEEDPCLHSLTAAIVAKQKHDAGESDSENSRIQSQLIYDFEETPTKLRLQRIIVGSDGKRSPLALSLSRQQKSGVYELGLAPRPIDFTIEELLHIDAEGALQRSCIPKIFSAMRGLENIFLQGAKINVDPHPRGKILNITRDGSFYILEWSNDPELTRAYTNGAVICAQTLHPEIDLKALNPQILRVLNSPQVRLHRVDYESLVSQHLKEIQNIVPLRFINDHTPEIDHTAKCLLHFELQGTSYGLTVRARIAYGEDPVIAFVSEKNGSLRTTNTTLLPRRDLSRELKLIDVLATKYGLELDKSKTLDLIESTLLAEKLRRDEVVIHELNPKWKLDAFVVKGELSPDVHMDGESLAVGFNINHALGTQAQVDLKEVASAWDRREAYVRTTDGSQLFKIPGTWIEKHREVIEEYLFWRDAAKDQNTSPQIRQLVSVQMQNSFLSQSTEISKDVPQYSVPPEMIETEIADAQKEIQAHLRPYQQEGIAWLLARKKSGFGVILADEMGLGKTIQTLGIMKRRTNTLVICPTSLIYNWQGEITRFRPDLKVVIYHGSDRHFPESTEDGVIITSYNLLRIDQQKFNRQVWDHVVLDEAHFIKNPDSQTAQAVFSLPRRFSLALTGTPIENRMLDLWSLMNFANPFLLGSRDLFSKWEHQNLGRSHSKQHIINLRQRCSPFILRRLKSQVAKDLPDRIETVVSVDLNQEQRREYEAFYASARQQLQDIDGQKLSKLETLELILRLRQICCDLRLRGKISTEESPKVRAALDILRSAIDEGHKVLVFSQWTSFLDILEQAFDREFAEENDGVPRRYRLDGTTKDRHQIVENFTNDSRACVFFMSIKAGGVGLNLTAADHVIICDPWWNPAAEDQAADRAHRIGQKRSVQIFKLIARQTLEEQIIELQTRKRELAAAILSQEDFADEAAHSLALKSSDLNQLFAIDR